MLEDEIIIIQLKKSVAEVLSEMKKYPSETYSEIILEDTNIKKLHDVGSAERRIINPVSPCLYHVPSGYSVIDCES